MWAPTPRPSGGRPGAGGPAPAGLVAPVFPLPDATGEELASLVPPGAIGLYPCDAGLNLAVTFYAWRSLLPLSTADDPTPAAIARTAGLERAPRYLLLPASPPPEAADQTEDLRAALVTGEATTDVGERWSAARIP